jgi:hypothetical protein
MNGLIATGGDDGAVKIWNAEEILQKKVNNEESKETQILKFNLPLPQAIVEKEEEKEGEETVVKKMKEEFN